MAKGLNKSIDVTVRIDSAAFRDFAVFDTMKMRRQWRRPALFSGIFLISACLCFLLANETNQGIFLGIFLLVIGFGLPIVYFASFFSSVHRQAHAFGMEKPRYVYNVTLKEDSITYTPANPNGNDPVAPIRTAWEDVYGAWKTDAAIYLYVEKHKAYLMPNGQANVKDDKLWDYLREKLGENRCHISG